MLFTWIMNIDRQIGIFVLGFAQNFFFGFRNRNGVGVEKVREEKDLIR